MNTLNTRISQLNRKLGYTLIALFFVNSLVSQTFELVKNISPGEYSFINGLTVYNDRIYFCAHDDVHGVELWSSDGTIGGTQLFKDIYPGSNSGLDPYGFGGAVYNNILYFNSASNNPDGSEIWASDGTNNGTHILAPGLVNFNSGLFEYNGELYFTGFSDDHGIELWVTDGTMAGTHLLKDINSGVYDSDPSDFTIYDGKLYFIADDDIHGGELWVTDGTTSGTQLIMDTEPGSYGGMNTIFTAFNGKLYFSTSDGVNGVELWISDGTTAGTTMLKDINPGSDDSYPSEVTEYNGKLYFNADDGIHGEELWVTDGTEAGTQMLKDINPGSDDATNYYYGIKMVEYNGKLYFTADNQANNNATGRELWATDGTEAGTQLVKDLYPGQPNGNPKFYTEYNGKLYFIASDDTPDRGEQLWVTDGTSEGTSVVLPDFSPNENALSNTFQFIIFDGSLYFKANYDENGEELWKFTANNLSTAEQAGNAFIVYPNPVKDILQVGTNAENIQKIDLFSITGQRLKTWKRKTDINLSQFAPGSYFVKITAQDGKTVVKQVVKK